MTLTTVGYGDFVPSTNTSKMVTVFFALSGAGVFLYILTAIASDYLKKKQKNLLRVRSKRK